MAGFTNRGKFAILGIIFNATTAPATFNVALVTNATPPTQDINTFGQLTEIAAGNGYTTGGINCVKNTTDFPTITEDDTADIGFIRVKNLVWTAGAGPIPASGNGARWAVLTDANATVANREVWAYWDLVSDRSVSAGQTLTLQSAELRFTE